MRKRLRDLGKKLASLASFLPYLPLLGLALAAISFVFGGGYPLTFLTRPRLQVERLPSLVMENVGSATIVLNACQISNESSSTSAQEIIVRVGSAEERPFTGLTISGAEGRWDVTNGGHEIDIELIRLLPSHVLRVTVATEEAITFFCEVGYQDGIVSLQAKQPFLVFLKQSTNSILLLIIIALQLILLQRLFSVRNRRVENRHHDTQGES